MKTRAEKSMPLSPGCRTPNDARPSRCFMRWQMTLTTLIYLLIDRVELSLVLARLRRKGLPMWIVLAILKGEEFDVDDHGRVWIIEKAA